MARLGFWAPAVISVAGFTGIAAGFSYASASPPGAAAAVTAKPAPQQQVALTAGEEATREVVKQANVLGASIGQARNQILSVEARAFAKLKASEASVAAERSALASEQLQLGSEAQRLSSEAASLTAESATLQRSAAALRTAEQRFAAQVAATRAGASSQATAPYRGDDGGGSYGGTSNGGGHDN